MRSSAFPGKSISMTYENILFTLEGGVAKLTLNRPDKLNSFTDAMHEEVAGALDKAVKDGARVLLLTGAGRGFCTGQDLSARPFVPGEKIDGGASLENHYNPLMRKLAALPFPFLCAVNGVAAGAGANIALAADMVIAAKSARFIQAFAKLGLVPDAGGTWMLPRLAGQARAMGLMLTGEPLSAQQAFEWGLIWKVVEDSELPAQAGVLAAQLAAAPTRALAAIRRALRGSWNGSFDAQLDLERDLQREMAQTSDYREGLSAFLEKRLPKFTGK